MLVSWNWLQDFVDLEGLTPQELAHTLTLAGLEIEGVEHRGENLQGIVVGRVETVEPHPDADRLRVCTVFDGKDTLQVVCGAANVTPGMMAPLATIGAVMPSGLKIKKSKLRGQSSEGMLCSASEIGCVDEVDGLMELDSNLEVGSDIADALQLRDVVLDIDLTPNRGDCLSIRGVAREVSVLLGRPMRQRTEIPMDLVVESSGERAEDLLRVRIDSHDRCGRYAAAIVRNVRVVKSPQWMRRRLEAVGQRPLNNIIDVTNYINIGYGQPTHAFDLEKLAGGEIVVRQAESGEKLTLLDGKELVLDSDDMVIADAKSPIALAGVMGGLDSSVDENTRHIVLEVANFDGTSVRRSAQRAHLHTDASHRFERGVDPTQVPEIVERAIQLFAAVQPEGTDVTRAEGVIDIVEREWPERRLTLNLKDLKRIIGVEYTAEETRNALEGLGFTVTGDEDMVVQVPVRRPDVERTIDLVEEVGRVIGYERLPNALPSGELGYIHRRREDAPVAQKSQPIVTNQILDDLQALRTTLYAQGAFEAVNWGISDESTNEILTGVQPPVRLKNPLSPQLSVMRSTLLAGLLSNVKYNLARRAERVALFEIGQVFDSSDEEQGESNMLAGVLTGERGKGWQTAGQTVDVWDMTAWIIAAGRALKRPVRLEPATDAPPWMHPKAGAAVVCEGQKLGFIGQIHPEIAQKLDMDAEVFAFEVSIADWVEVPPVTVTNVRLPRTVGADRDLAVVVDADLPFSHVADAIASFSHPLASGWRLFDVYRGENLPEGKQSLAFRASYQHETDALTDEQIDEAHQAFTEHLNQAVGAVRRG